MAFEKELALGKLELDTLKMAAGGERVAMAVLLGTHDASGCAGGAPWVFRVALSISLARC